MHFVLLISDLQEGSFQSGLLRKDLKSGLQSCEIIDITHQLRLNNLLDAAFVCKQVQLNDNHSHIVYVRLGNTRESVVYQHLLNLYILPNNGLLYMLFEDVSDQDVRIISRDNEIFAIKAFSGGHTNEIHGLSSRSVKRLNKTLQQNGSLISADCLFTDVHGNCYFNIRKDEFERIRNNRSFRIKIQHIIGQEFKTIHHNTDEVPPGEALFRFNRAGYLKLLVNMGNARQLFRIKDDTRIMIEIYDSKNS